jgi:hypothetical protein
MQMPVDNCITSPRVRHRRGLIHRARLLAFFAEGPAALARASRRTPPKSPLVLAACIPAANPSACPR